MLGMKSNKTNVKMSKKIDSYRSSKVIAFDILTKWVQYLDLSFFGIGDC